MNKEHTCIKDDGGTALRRCYACEQEEKAKEIVIDYSKLEALKPRLVKVSAVLDSRIAEIEKKLAQLQIGIATFVKIYDASEGRPRLDLGYAKIDQQWHLVMKRDYDITLLNQCTRSERIAGLRAVPQLIDGLEKQANKLIKKIEETFDIETHNE